MRRPDRRRGWDRWLAKRLQPANPTRLTQRRIYILPTLQGVGFAGVLLVMLLAAINYQNSLAYALTFLLAAVVFVSVLHTYRNLVGLTLSAASTPAVFLGEEAIFGVRLDGLGRTRHAVSLGWQALPESAQWVDVESNVLASVHIPLETQRRGRLRPGRLRVESRFPLGLIQAWSWVDLDQSVLVYPRPMQGQLPLARRVDSEVQSGESAPVGISGVDDYQGLRVYQPGDPKRRLHWKAYSRGQGLLVKDFTSAAGQELALDFDVMDGPVEARLSLLCHAVLNLSERGQAFSLRLPGVNVPAGQGETHRASCLEALALHGAHA